MRQIINSLLETDLYKFNMQNIVAKNYSDYKVVWTFKCRNDDVRFTSGMVNEIRRQIDLYCDLVFKDDEIEWLKANLPWLGEGYLNFLRLWKPVRKEILVNEGDIVPYNDCGLAIEARGTWLNTMMYEIAVLAIVNEVYFSYKYGIKTYNEAFKKRAKVKCDELAREIEGGEPPLVFSEFGLRRRYSGETQDWLIDYLANERKMDGFVGTSNVYLARKYGVKPIGTMAHELVQCIGQGNHELNPAYSNKFAMKAWTDEYETRNGIVLGDTITTDCFLKDFGLTFATLFSGVRHDSGDPIIWGEKILSHYKKLGIDPRAKTLLFSDSLDFKKAREIERHFRGRCNIAFGIGTFLSNDCGVDVKPLNIVMKVTECNGSPVAKLSDVEGKNMARDPEYIEFLRRTIEWRMSH